MSTRKQATEKLPKRDMLGFGVGALPVNMTFGLVMLYLPYFYTDIFLLPPTILAVLFIACRVWDGINDPIMGMVADSTNSRWGKYRPYLLFTPIPMVVFAGLTFYVPDMGATAKVIWAFVTYFGLQMIKTAVAVPYFALPALMTTKSTERTALSSLAMIFAPIAFLVASTMTLKVVEQFPTEKEGFFYTVTLFTAVSAIFSFVTFFTMRKYDYPGNKLFLRQDNTARISLREKWEAMRQNRPFMISVVTFFGHNAAIAIQMGIMIYFFKYNLEMFSLYPAYMGIIMLAGVFGAMTAPLFVKKIGKKTTFIMTTIVTAVCQLSIVLLSYDKGAAELAPLWGFGGSCFYLVVISSYFTNFAPVISTVLMADSVDYGEWKTGQRAQGLISSIFLLSNKAGTALGGALIGIGLSLIGYAPNLPQYSRETLNGILVMLFFIPMAARILMMICMWFYNLSDSQFADIIEELNSTKSKSKVAAEA